MAARLDRSSLKAFENAAAGHEGTLSDETGALFIKPSTEQEVQFYEDAREKCPALAACMPKYMGTLSLSANAPPATSSEPAASDKNVKVAEAAESTSVSETGPRLFGKKISSDIGIVLESYEYGFTRANVIDLKLGSKLCAPGTSPEKVARLDKVAAETTSGSLDFRIAGMKVWDGSTWKIYDKYYGRQFKAENVVDGFRAFVLPLIVGLEKEYARHMLQTFKEEVEKIRKVFESCETRMYGASVLIVYEGDLKVLRSLMVTDEQTDGHDSGAGGEKDTSHVSGGSSATAAVSDGTDEVERIDDDESEDDESEDETPQHPFRVGMVDFAHASFQPGEGSDANVVRGLQNIELEFGKVMAELV